MTEEEWRPVEDFEGSYSVSNLGRVRSEPRVVYRRDGNPLRVPGKILSLNLQGGGYLIAQISVPGRRKALAVHRAVCKAFCPGFSPLSNWALHRDGNRLNNTPENLYWGSPKDNARDMILAGNHGSKKSATCKRGHDWTLENTYIYPKTGDRACLTCRKMRRNPHWRDSNG